MKWQIIRAACVGISAVSAFWIYGFQLEYTGMTAVEWAGRLWPWFLTLGCGITGTAVGWKKTNGGAPHKLKKPA
jgi:hypothetical protein